MITLTKVITKAHARARGGTHVKDVFQGTERGPSN